MSDLSNEVYFAMRAASSRELALRATNAMVAAIHLELATRYEAMAAASTPSEPLIITEVQAA